MKGEGEEEEGWISRDLLFIVIVLKEGEYEASRRVTSGGTMLLIHAFISWVCGSRAFLLLSFSVVFLFVFFIHLYITFWSSVYPFCRVRHPFLFFLY